jgi:hypothetical protein
MYEITITNGFAIPILGGVFYSRTGGLPASEIGGAATTGFVGSLGSLYRPESSI